MQQHYRLGGQIKERYAGFLADEYNANTVDEPNYDLLERFSFIS